MIIMLTVMIIILTGTIIMIIKMITITIIVMIVIIENCKDIESADDNTLVSCLPLWEAAKT